MHICFVLVDPVVPENVGFCARGLTTMGFDDLRIVGQPLHEEKGARNTAYGSHELLERVRVFPSFEEAVADCELVVGTTAKTRVKRSDFFDPEGIRQILREKPQGTKIAIVFGSETNGLNGEDIAHCDLLSTIPLKTTYPSLNLAQAVLIYAYELAKGPEVQGELTASNQLISRLKEEAIELLDSLDYDRHPINKQRIMDRLMLLGEKDSELVMGVLKKLRRRLK